MVSINIYKLAIAKKGHLSVKRIVIVVCYWLNCDVWFYWRMQDWVTVWTVSRGMVCLKKI